MNDVNIWGFSDIDIFLAYHIQEDYLEMIEEMEL